MIVSRHAIFLEKEFIQGGGSGKNIELKKVQDVQNILELSIESSQPEVPNKEIYPPYTPSLWRSDRVYYAPPWYMVSS